MDSSALIFARPMVFLQAHFMRYQTEIIVAADRYVCLQLPSFFPEGRAVVVVMVESEVTPILTAQTGDDPDRQDIEWFDEFDDEEVNQLP